MLFSILTVSSQDRDSVRYSAESKVFENNLLDIRNKIEVFPNPSIDYLVVSISNSTLIDATFEVHSLIGNSVELMMEQVADDRYVIDVKEFSSGYYFLIIKDDQVQFKRAYKFLKK